MDNNNNETVKLIKKTHNALHKNTILLTGDEGDFGGAFGRHTIKYASLPKSLFPSVYFRSKFQIFGRSIVNCSKMNQAENNKQ